MREPGIAGAVRGKRVLTTLPDQQPERAPDRVDRDFVAGAPNRCRGADFTPAATWAAVVHLAFAVDTRSRRSVGRPAATPKETRLALDTLKTALWQHDRDEYPYARGELTHHTDADSQYTGFRPSEHPDTAGIAASTGSAGAAYDNAPREHDRPVQNRMDQAAAAPEGPLPGRAGHRRCGPTGTTTAGSTARQAPSSRRGRGQSLHGIQETPGHNHNLRSLPNPGRSTVRNPSHFSSPAQPGRRPAQKRRPGRTR